MFTRSVHHLIDYSQDAGIVFRGTNIPVEKLFQVCDYQNSWNTVDNFVQQYPEVKRTNALALLEIAGYRGGFIFQNFLSVSPGALNNQCWRDDTPKSIEEFKVNWQDIIISVQDVPCDQFQYFKEIYSYGNSNTEEEMIFGRVFEFRNNPEFERLLKHCHNYYVFDDFIAKLFSETAIYTELKPFSTTSQDLHQLINNAYFTQINPFYVEAELSSYLYHTGLYESFYQKHSTQDAQEITRDFLNKIFNHKPEDGLFIMTHFPWGAWFDKHSVTDLTIVGINFQSRQIWLFTVTDSD